MGSRCRTSSAVPGGGRDLGLLSPIAHSCRDRRRNRPADGQCANSLQIHLRSDNRIDIMVHHARRCHIRIAWTQRAFNLQRSVLHEKSNCRARPILRKKTVLKLYDYAAKGLLFKKQSSRENERLRNQLRQKRSTSFVELWHKKRVGGTCCRATELRSPGRPRRRGP